MVSTPTLDPEIAAWLDKRSEEFDRAVRMDSAYVIEFAEAGARLLAKREELDAA